MKCLFFTSGMTRGGAEHVIATLSNRMVVMGHSVSILMIKGHGSEYALDPRVTLISANLQPGMRNGLKALSFYSKTVHDLRPDAVIAFTTKPNEIACAARLLGKAKAPLIISERADPFSRNKAIQRICNVLFRQADLCVCQSKQAERYYEGRVGSRCLTVIENPLDISSVADDPATNREPFVFTAGRLAPDKRHDLTIKTFSLVADNYPELRLKICGAGDYGDVLKRLADDVPNGDRIDFVGSIPKVAKANASASAFLFSSDSEGFPNALIEAAASGIPIVTTNFSPGTAPEVVKDGVNGYIVPRGDAAAMAESLVRLLDNPPERSCLADVADKVKTRFATDRVVDQWIAVMQAMKEVQRG